MVISALKTLKNKIESVSLTRFRSISKVLLFGILIRLLLAVYLSHDWDFQVWYVSFADIVAGLRSPYTAMNFSYPPIWAFTLTPFASLFSLLANSHDGLVRVSLGGPIIAATHPLFNLLVRLPLIASEVFIGLLIYDHVLKFKNENMAYKAFILWFLNPFVIFVSCVFGQFDVLVTLMVVLAFVFFLEKKYALCGLSIGLGALTKIYPIYLLPLYMIFTLKIDLKEKSKRLIIAKDTLQHCGLIFGGLLLSLFLIIPPLIISGSFYNFVQAVLRRTDYITSLGGISPTNAIYILGPDVFVWLNEPGRPQFIFSALSIVLWVSTLAVSLYYSFRSKLSSDHQRFLYIQTLTIVCLYLAALMVNPQYVIWIIPFLVLCYGIYGNYFKRIIILSVSALLFALFWIKPFNSLMIYSNISQLGIYFNQLHSSYQATIGYPLMVFSGLLGSAVLISLFFPRLSFKKLFKALNASQLKGENL